MALWVAGLYVERQPRITKLCRQEAHGFIYQHLAGHLVWSDPFKPHSDNCDRLGVLKSSSQKEEPGEASQAEQLPCSGAGSGSGSGSWVLITVPPNAFSPCRHSTAARVPRPLFDFVFSDSFRTWPGLAGFPFVPHSQDDMLDFTTAWVWRLGAESPPCRVYLSSAVLWFGTST